MASRSKLHFEVCMKVYTAALKKIASFIANGTTVYAWHSNFIFARKDNLITEK